MFYVMANDTNTMQLKSENASRGGGGGEGEGCVKRNTGRRITNFVGRNNGFL